MARKPATASKKASKKTTKAKSKPKSPTATKKSTPRKPRSTKKFLRNLTGSEFRLRLDRHGKDGRPIQLKPRGQRGDLSPLQPEDLADPILVANIEIGAVEVITEAEALKAAGKQTTNQQKVHPALASLRNELGEPYQGEVIVEPSWEDQGVVVAELEDGQVAIDRGTGIRRKRGPGEAPGLPNEVVGAEPGYAPAGEEAAYLSDLKARDKSQQGPEAGLGGIKHVRVAPTKKT